MAESRKETDTGTNMEKAAGVDRETVDWNKELAKMDREQAVKSRDTVKETNKETTIEKNKETMTKMSMETVAERNKVIVTDTNIEIVTERNRKSESERKFEAMAEKIKERTP